ncbi:MAG: TonB-dependent receptor, partial [Myxococcales bacterium]|nr:TonB-dependent receptor [Myxococcales bacterium]
QPELSLFPVSMFTIARVDTVRGGATVRFGPRTSGGVINLVSQPIPENPTLSVFAQSDQFGDAAVATSYGGTHRKLGMYFEYAPRFGKSFREHSEFQAHGGLIKLSYPVTSKFTLLSTTHLFYEHSDLPGGLYRFQYDENRLQSVREQDYFEGSRVGTALRGRWRPKDDHELQVLGWYNYTERMSVMRSDQDREWAEAPVRSYVPRTYSVFGAETRYALRVDSPKRRLFQDFTFGARAMYELGTDQRCIDFLQEVGDTKSNYQLRDMGVEPCVEMLRRGFVEDYDVRVRVDNDGRYAGYALFADDKLHLLDGKMAVYGGVRVELMNFGIRNNLAQFFERRFLPQLSPAVSIWGTPRDEVSLFASFGRSLGAPSFKIADGSARDGRFMLEEINQFEVGAKLLELGGVYLELTGWFRDIHNMVDSGEQGASDLVNAAWASGAEADLSWAPGDLWESLEGLEFNVGYAFTYSRITESNSPGTVGKLLAWYPIHETWGGVSHEFPWGLRFGSNVYWQDEQFTDYANTPTEGDQPSTPAGGAGVGKIPAYATWGAYLGVRRRVGARLATRVEFTLGVKNILNAEYFFRSDDTNAGLYAGRPRTFYFNFGLAHEFLGRRRRAAVARMSATQRFWARSGARVEHRLYRGTGRLPGAGGTL